MINRIRTIETEIEISDNIPRFSQYSSRISIVRFSSLSNLNDCLCAPGMSEEGGVKERTMGRYGQEKESRLEI